LWKYWAIWTPTQCITFSIVPEHLRIPFIAAVSFGWLILLSSITSRGDASPQEDDYIVICYDNECLIMDRLSFVGPSSLINEDGSSAGVQIQPNSGGKANVVSAGPSSLVNEKDGSSIGVEVPPGVEVVAVGEIVDKS
jgi:hypothetical protein